MPSKRHTPEEIIDRWPTLEQIEIRMGTWKDKCQLDICRQHLEWISTW